MLGDPKRLRTPGGYGYLVSWKHRFRLNNDAEAVQLVERVLADPHNVEALRAGLARPEATEEELAAWLITGLAGGGLQLLKTNVLPPLFDAPSVTPLRPDRPKPNVERPTWISLEVVREDGTPTPDLGVLITAPDGSVRDARLDADSRFRADDIPRGDGGCTIVVHAEAAMAGPTSIVVNDDDVLVDPGAPFRVELATSRHHRLVVVEGKTELVLLDADGKPIRDRRCRVVVDGRTRQSLTDDGGKLTVHHLRNAEVFGVEFPGLDEGGAG
ncbi:MAG: hypothetical protein KUG77_03835 [Nannocystaceae bacterium]|nr:hypothetical protein [Nannocystaceae bacterium]